MEQSVRLVSYTVPVFPEMGNNPQDLLSYVARVSNPANQENFKTGAGLLKYCAKNNHWSVFEMADVTLEIKTSRDIGRQVLRHRSFSFQEFSQRYAEVPTGDDDFYFKEARLQDKKNRQNSLPTNDAALTDMWKQLQRLVKNQAIQAYQWALVNGIAKEVARSVLPEGMTPSVMYMKGSVRSWIHYCALRTGNGTQKEHQDLARLCLDQISLIFPFLREYSFTWNEEEKVVEVAEILESQPFSRPRTPAEEHQAILDSLTKISPSGLPYA